MNPEIVCFSSLSCDQALLRLPAAAETPNAPHQPPAAAGLHAGRAQTQELQLLAQHRPTDAFQKVNKSERQRSSQLVPELYPSILISF